MDWIVSFVMLIPFAGVLVLACSTPVIWLFPSLRRMSYRIFFASILTAVIYLPTFILALQADDYLFRHGFLRLDGRPPVLRQLSALAGLGLVIVPPLVAFIAAFGGGWVLVRRFQGRGARNSSNQAMQLTPSRTESTFHGD